MVCRVMYVYTLCGIQPESPGRAASLLTTEPSLQLSLTYVCETGSHDVALTDVELRQILCRNLFASCPWVLGGKVCTTTPGPFVFLKQFNYTPGSLSIIIAGHGVCYHVLLCVHLQIILYYLQNFFTFCIIFLLILFDITFKNYFVCANVCVCVGTCESLQEFFLCFHHVGLSDQS